MSRFLPLLALVALAATATAQPVYNGLDGPYFDDYDESPGVRVGIGVGPYVYLGPDQLFGVPRNQDDVVATNLGVTGEVTFPLSGNLYGRLMGGLLNIGAEDGRADVGSDAANPFLTGQTVLAEADLLYYFNRPRAGAISPYAFTGLAGLFATGDAAPGVETTALAIPVGLGLEYGVSRNLALFAEGSFRFGLTEVGSPAFTASASMSDDVCDATSPSYDFHACKKKGGTPFCPNGGAVDDRCRDVDPDGDDRDFRTRFNSILGLAGLRLGFGGSPEPRIPPPPPYTPPPYEPPPAPVTPPPPPAPLVCEIVELNSVYFDYGTGSLDRRARSLLDENVELLLDDTACCVFIDGYTDTSEGGRFGMGLAARRAQAVYDYYLSRGISSSRLQVRNRGMAAPDCDKEDPGPGCERNRRVESLPVDCERFRFLIENPSYDPY